MSRNCECGAVIPPQIGPGRPRVKCTSCSKTKSHGRRRKATVSPLREAPAPVAPAVESLEARTRADLELYGRAECTEGAAALFAARMLDAGGHTASGAASLLREVRAAKEAAISGSAVAGDVVDDLRAKRRARTGS